MDQNQHQESSLFEMNMDASAQSYLLSVSKWTKFISIVGFITCALVLILFAAYGQNIIQAFSVLISLGSADRAGILIAIVVVAAVLVFLWLFFLIKSSNLLKRGLDTKNTALIADGFKAMRIYFSLSIVINLLNIISTLSNMF